MPSKEYVQQETIMMNVSKSVTWLCDELTNSRSQILVLDCRPHAEFQQAHIRGSINVALPTLMLRRLANGKLSLTNAINGNEGRDKFSKSYKTHAIVLLDDNGEDLSGYTSCEVVPTLLRRLQQDGCRAVFVEGGFKTFHAHFPEWCLVESGETPVIGLQNLRISCSDSESDEDPFGSDSGLGGDIPIGYNSGPVEILPHLFLGNAQHSADKMALEKSNITYILNVTTHLPNVFERDHNFKYMKIPINDHFSQNLGKYFSEAINFIDEARDQKTGVLVHCVAGISRSVTIVIAYLIHSQNLTLNTAYDFVKQRKDKIAPNINFMGQLVEFERQHHSSPARRMCCSSPSCSSSSAFSSPELTPSPFSQCHINRDGTVRQFSDTLHTSPDSGIGFESWS